MKCPKCGELIKGLVCKSCGCGITDTAVCLIGDGAETQSKALSEEIGSVFRREQEKRLELEEMALKELEDRCKNELEEMAIKELEDRYRNDNNLSNEKRTYDALKKNAEFDNNKKHNIAVVAVVLSFCLGAFALFRTGVLNLGGNSSALSDSFISSAKQGDAFFLGKYEQDNNLDNGAEDIEWLVVKNYGDSILAVSKYCLDSKPYNDVEDTLATDWEHCTIRQWLNGDFYNDSFSEEDKKRITPTNIQNPDSVFFELPGGNNTVDNVFLLSSNDIASNIDGFKFVLYSRSLEDGDGKISHTSSKCEDTTLLKATMTEYAKEHYLREFSEDSWSIYSDEEAKEKYAEFEQEHGENACDWWLRSRGDNFFSCIAINHRGNAMSYSSNYGATGVRPAIIVSKLSKKDNNQTSGSASDITQKDDTGSYYFEEADQSDVVTQVSAAEKQNPLQIVYNDQQVTVLKNDQVVRIAYSRNKQFDEFTDIKKIAVCDDMVVALSNTGRVLLSSEAKELYGIDELPLNDIVDIGICRDAVNPEDESKKGCILALASDGILCFSYVGGYGAHRTDVAAISANHDKYVAILNDGSVLAHWQDNGDYSSVREWKDVRQAVCGDTFIAGLKNDGTVVASGGYLTGTLNGQILNLTEEDWKRKSDDWTRSVEFDLSGWHSITSIAAGDNHLVGLRADGTVVSTGLNSYGQCDTDEWSGVISIEAGNNITIGHQEDGVIVAGKELLENIIELQKMSTSYMYYTY